MIIVPLKTENNLYPRGYKMFKQATRTMILLVKTRTDEKFSIVPEEGWFGQPKFSTPSKNHPTLCWFLLFYSSYPRGLGVISTSWKISSHDKNEKLIYDNC